MAADRITGFVPGLAQSLIANKIDRVGPYSEQAGLYQLNDVAGQDWVIIALVLPSGKIMFYSELEGEGLTGSFQLKLGGAFQVSFPGDSSATDMLVSESDSLAVKYEEGGQTLAFALPRVAQLEDAVAEALNNEVETSSEKSARDELEFNWLGTPGFQYKIETSTDAVSWNDYRDSRPGQDGAM